jgi:hypothetical protein
LNGKAAGKMLVKLTPNSQFHQNFMSNFFCQFPLVKKLQSQIAST